MKYTEYSIACSIIVECFVLLFDLIIRAMRLWFVISDGIIDMGWKYREFEI